MKYLDEFRDPVLARQLVAAIHAAAEPARDYPIMEFCGGHTHSIFRYGIPQLLPDNVRMLHGPGCPVCVLPIKRIDAAIALALQPDVILCSYGDMLRVPGSGRMSLLKAKADGADVRMIYSPADALQLAIDTPNKTVVFFAVGFETTTPPTAVVMQQALDRGLNNFKIFCNHVLTPPAIHGIMAIDQAAQHNIKALVGPGHVSLITGAQPYEALAARYHVPIVIAGFEALDLLRAILLCVRQINAGTCTVENEYSRAVRGSGNRKAQQLMQKLFVMRERFEWRGLGELPDSALAIAPEFAHLDAEQIFAAQLTAHAKSRKQEDNKACACPSVLTGQTRPDQCTLFNNPCTPENPLGSCMVSSEGACAAYFNYQAVPLRIQPVASAAPEFSEH